MKTLSIITICLAGLSFLAIITLNASYDYEASSGWGFLIAVWSLAFGITALVKSIKK